MRHLGDIKKISGYKIEPVDCITGGSPCQDLSVAGKRAGLDGERSGLFMEQMRVVKEMRDATTSRGSNQPRPRFMVWENVPGAFNSNGGKDFQTVLTEIVRIAESDAPDVPLPNKWSKSGCLYDEMGRWSIAWRVHDAQFWGVPQRRKRIALVADFAGRAAPEVLFEREGLSWHYETSGESREEIAGAVGRGVKTPSGCLNSWDIQSKHIQSPAGVAETLWSGEKRYGGGEAYVFDARGSGDGEITPTITGDHENRITDYAEIGIQPETYAKQSHSEYKASEQVSACKARDYKGATDLVIQPFAVDCRNGTENPDINGTLQAKSNGGFSVNLQKQGSVVRRLTPLECERLQGYPDNWTDIGDWTDSNGKVRKAADSLRYKAIGNSIALPFWFYLLRRISAQYERPATLGSLFDGIGGFPLCWERCNGKGTALWTSEVEEFCIAVTKRHFGDEEIHNHQTT